MKKNKILVPTLQYIYEQLFSLGLRNYCFVVGREKRSIKDHFTPNSKFLNELSKHDASILSPFYNKLEKSNIHWITQNNPRGFGDAVKHTEKFVSNDDFLLHAGDVIILNSSSHPILRLIELAKKNPSASAILLFKKVKDHKKYGVPQVSKFSDHFIIKNVEEKPTKPKSEFGLLPIYYFKPHIFSCLKNIHPGKNNEFQITDAIQKLIDDGKTVLGIALKNNEYELDVGTVNSYKHALDTSFKKA